jgi:acyl-CoA synthetase (AMP-forming)/AMP-acid ligase II
MLYERWRQIARSSARHVALRDLSAGRCWTFADLAAQAEAAGPEAGPVVFPQGMSVDFVLSVLRGWRDGRVVCPLEIGQAAPLLTGTLPEGVVHVKTTSATTGTPRLVAFRAEQLKADADNIVASMGLRAEWPNLGVISLAHSYGFSNLVLPLLLHGIPLCLLNTHLPEAVRCWAETEPHVTLAAVPALWRTWHDAGAIPNNVRLAISAGAPLPVALEQGVFAARGLKIHNFYGSSECGGIAYDSSATPRTDGACVGASMRNVLVSVSEDGCLEIRGSAVGHGYWPEPSAALGGGVFRTSDLAEISRGLIYLRGRASDLINVAGRKVAPETIEQVLARHPAVRENLVFGIPSSEPQRSETIVACLSARGNITPEQLRQYLLKALPAWQVPREWWLVPSLAVNGRGKLSRAEWRKRFLEKAASA